LKKSSPRKNAINISVVFYFKVKIVLKSSKKVTLKKMGNSKSYHRGFGYNYNNRSSSCNNNIYIRDYSHNGSIRDYNHDEPITASDFREGACRMMGLGFIDDDIAQSAFNIYDHNRKGYLDQNEASCAYGYVHRLYS